MAVLNYYAALKRGDANTANPGKIVKTSNATASVGSGATYDVEVRMQINNGTALTGLTKNDVVNALMSIIGDIQSNGIVSGAGSGADLPAN